MPDTQARFHSDLQFGESSMLGEYMTDVIFGFFAESVRRTKTGTLRISHTSSSHTLIGERANKRRSFENAKLYWKIQTST